MAHMPNQSYLSVWCPEFTEDRLLEHYAAFLGTVPFSAGKPGFDYLTIRAVDSTESPILEMDLRSVPLDPAGIIELSKDHLHSDCAYEARAHWDLWDFEPASAAGFRNEPQAVELFAHGEDYDDGAFNDNGHMRANLGFEDFFVGQAGILDVTSSGDAAPAQTPEDARFLEAMAWPENLEKYQEKTRDNIRKLLDWVRAVEKAIPGGRVRLWSEGEENLEARLEEILAAH
jgi:hypothetical protein